MKGRKEEGKREGENRRTWDGSTRWRGLRKRLELNEQNLMRSCTCCLLVSNVYAEPAGEGGVASGKLSSSTLGRYTCVALAGVSTEYLQYGVAEGGIGDVMQLDSLLKALNFSQ
eukprot:scaffold317228_cov14-Prasinocladus_malaysianus.AAC.1